jgi:DNA-binding PucR family transcriptional regulator
LGRIEDLLGVDLRNAEVRLALHLALKIGEVLEA